MTTKFKKAFRNCEYFDYSKDEHKNSMLEAIAKTKSEFGKEYPQVVGPVKRWDKDPKYCISSYNPSNKTELIGMVPKGTQENAKDALDAATKTFETWKRVPIEKRIDIMLNARKLLIERRHEFNAYCVLESGQTWNEADGEVAETIDFLDFYSRHAEKWCAKRKVTAKADEEGFLQYIPLGVGAVIPPWNYPCAILAGLIIAPVVAGNTVVVKPASDTPVIGYKFVELLEQAGLPLGVVSFVPGSGKEVGEYLVNSPKTRFIAFTGSRDVGVHIYESLAKQQEKQVWLKRFIAEMGGKNAHIIDSECYLESAVLGTMQAAFGRQGQKCSSCSRAIVDETVYDKFVDMLVEKTRQLKVGPSEDFANNLGPVINKQAFDKICQYICIGSAQGKIVAGGRGDFGKGYFIEPTIIKDVAWNSTIAQEEIFGPVLAVIKAKNFDEALKMANSTEYGLTGGVYTQNEEKLERAIRDFHVGNLYLNRKCTGALVGVHPFGGFNHSGTDSKTGGPEYVLNFLQAKTVGRKVR
ncbi:MAG: L-glutamate gamma-semialdehyde dehydrogenase [Candidatus Nanoarchaeia archaeon]|nr:L-glutamate gamma-semialdehyde dehydrogenase [Candidatus Nanoarchaeia archaeon]